jgi:hypothetical protein
MALLLLQTAMIGTFLARDMLLFYVFWEAMLIPMYFLIGIWGGERRVYAAVKFFLFTMVGSVFMLVAILWCYQQAGSMALADFLQLELSRGQQSWLFGAFALAFAIKVPLFPFHICLTPTSSANRSSGGHPAEDGHLRRWPRSALPEAAGAGSLARLAGVIGSSTGPGATAVRTSKSGHRASAPGRCGAGPVQPDDRRRGRRGRMLARGPSPSAPSGRHHAAPHPGSAARPRDAVRRAVFLFVTLASIACRVSASPSPCSTRQRAAAPRLARPGGPGVVWAPSMPDSACSGRWRAQSPADQPARVGRCCPSWS